MIEFIAECFIVAGLLIAYEEVLKPFWKNVIYPKIQDWAHRE